MPRRRRTPKTGLDAFLEIVPPLAGLTLVAWFFIPGFKDAIAKLLVVLVVLLGVAFVGLLTWAVYRRSERKTDPTSVPTQLADTPAPPEPLSLPLHARSAASSPVLTRAEFSAGLLCEVEWKRFEDLVAGFHRELGEIARTTRIGADGGVDIEIVEPRSDRVVRIIQCKAWQAYRVGIKPVRELFGVMAASGVKAGAFFTTGTFTDEAQVFGQSNGLDLVDGSELLRRIRQLPTTAQLRLFKLATEGDYTTPTCPSCGVKMLLRTATKGRSEGDSFWGCRHYPRCKQTLRPARAA